mmetsp:Transcript_59817/g.120053  ORF Transcript_59817/g.120053 Transcript_59817/m.120053 type:complete len:391 (+) Transcript_59817:508-1680(+)
MERLWGFFVEPRRSAGEYTAIDPQTTDIENPWVALFTDYSPSQVHFLSLNVVIMVVEAFAFAAMRGWQQGVFLSLFSFVVTVAVVVSPPSVLLAQSRADTIDAFGRFLTFAIYSLVFPNWLNPDDAAQAMIVVNGVMLLHSILTQLEPVVELALVMVGGVGMFLGLSTSLSGFATTEEAVALVWQRLQTHHCTEGSIPSDFYEGLKKIAGASSGSTIPKRSQEDTKVGRIVLNQAAFDNMLAPLNLNQMLNEPKYSSDGRLSRFSRTVSRSLSLDSNNSPPMTEKDRTDKALLELSDKMHEPPVAARELSQDLSRFASNKNRNKNNIKGLSGEGQFTRDVSTSSLRAKGASQNARFSLEKGQMASSPSTELLGTRQFSRGGSGTTEISIV